MAGGTVGGLLVRWSRSLVTGPRLVTGRGRVLCCDPLLHDLAQRVVGRDIIELEWWGALVGVRVRVRA